jgi:hypothetical protein
MEEEGGALPVRTPTPMVGLVATMQPWQLHPAPTLVCLEEEQRRATSPLLSDRAPLDPHPPPVVASLSLVQPPAPTLLEPPAQEHDILAVAEPDV